MGNLDHWDAQRRRLNHGVQPLVGFVGVGGGLRVSNEESGLRIQPAASTVAWLLLAALGFVPYAIWAFFQTIQSAAGLAVVVAVGATLEFLLLRFLKRMQRLRIVGRELVIESLFGRKVTARFRADEFASMYLADAWYRSDGVETRNNVIWLSRVGGDAVPLVASDKDADEIATLISDRLGLPIVLGEHHDHK